MSFWTQSLDSGTAVSSVAEAIAHSDEYYQTFVIRPAYLNLLGRAADAGGVTFWTAQMDAGVTDQELEADLVSSPEFYANAGGTNTLWIDAVYKLLLGRARRQRRELLEQPVGRRADAEPGGPGHRRQPGEQHAAHQRRLLPLPGPRRRLRRARLLAQPIRRRQDQRRRDRRLHRLGRSITTSTPASDLHSARPQGLAHGSERYLDLAGGRSRWTSWFRGRIGQRMPHCLLGMAHAQLPERLRKRFDPEDVVQSVYRSFFRRLQEGEFTFDDSHDVWRLLATMTYCKARNLVKFHQRHRRDVSPRSNGE